MAHLLTLQHAHIYIYICCRVKMVQCLPFSVLKWSKFFVFEHLVLPAERKGFFKKNKKEETKNYPILVLKKLVQLCCATYLDQFFNTSLDQFLTHCFFGVFVETLIFIVFFNKNAKFRETQKGKTNTICEHICANCYCQNVPFSAFFIFVFWQFPNVQRCSLIGSQ